MRVYTKTCKNSENYPVKFHEEWIIKQDDKIAERWRIIDVKKKQFTAEVTEYFPVQ